MISREHIEKTGRICEFYIKIFHIYKRDLKEEFINLQTITRNSIHEVDERKIQYLKDAFAVVEEETQKLNEELFERYLTIRDDARFYGMSIDEYLKRRDVSETWRFKFKSFVERENYEYENAYPYGWKKYLKDKIKAIGNQEKYNMAQDYESQASEYNWHLRNLKSKAIELAELEMKDYLKSAGVHPKEAHSLMVNRVSVMDEQIDTRIEG